MEPKDFEVKNLGLCEFKSPLSFDSPTARDTSCFVTDDDRILWKINANQAHSGNELSFEKAGPRKKIFFNPEKTSVAIVTCGGLSPGLNNVIRSVFYELRENYGVKDIWGFRNGYLGMNPESKRDPLRLSYQNVGEIHKLGGTILGTSRGPQDPQVMVDFLVKRNIDILLTLGGDGTQRGSYELHQEVERRGLPIAILGIPKTIDNDIPFCRQTFGYQTALEKAAEVIRGAHVEARDAVNGIGFVKLMGRDAGFIAAGATIVSQEVNYCLVPEVPFPLEGEGGLLQSLERRMRERRHAVIVVAEGAGQHLFDQQRQQRDASGNPGHCDIGEFLRDKIKAHFAQRNFPISFKYLDPSYFVRSVPANVFDRILCDQLARNAVHAAMAGKTGMLIGQEHNQFIHVPSPIVTRSTKRIDVTGDIWRAVLQSTRQPRW